MEDDEWFLVQGSKVFGVVHFENSELLQARTKSYLSLSPFQITLSSAPFALQACLHRKTRLSRPTKKRLLELLLRTQLVRVTAFLLAAVGGAGWETSLDYFLELGLAKELVFWGGLACVKVDLGRKRW